jgi:hypothetical protein
LRQTCQFLADRSLCPDLGQAHSDRSLGHGLGQEYQFKSRTHHQLFHIDCQVKHT